MNLQEANELLDEIMKVGAVIIITVSIIITIIIAVIIINISVIITVIIAVIVAAFCSV